MKFRLIIDPTKAEEVVATVHSPSPMTQQIEALVMAHDGTDRLPAYQDDEMRLLRFCEIACVTVIDGKTFAISADGKQYRLKQKLYELENLLPSNFIRINKSALANELHLDSFHTAFSGAVDAVFRCGYREYVSRRCLTNIKRRYKTHEKIR